MPFNDFINRHGIKYAIIRNESLLSEQIGLPNTDSMGKRYIGFKPDADIKINDQLINPANEKVYVINVKTQFFGKEPQQLKAYYQTEYVHTNISFTSRTVVNNPKSISNSSAGNNNIATSNYQQLLSEIKAKVEKCEEDKEELQQIISLLELIANDKVQPTKGILSSFYSLMERHSWLKISVSGFILSFLTSQIP